MAKFCISCGAALNDTAKFCGSCGAPVDQVAGPVVEDAPAIEPAIVEPTPPPPPEPAPVYGTPEASAPEAKKPNWLLIGGGAAILLLLLLYYLIFIRDDVSSNTPAATTEKIEAKEGVETQYYAVADANIRDKATTVGTQIVGKLLRGTAASGTVITGADGTTQWLELADGKGFVAMSNISETQPPQIVKPLGDRIWIADAPIDLWAQPDAAAPVLDRVAAGTALTLYGLTANDYIEVKRPKGGVGYIADGARIAELANAKGKPIAISFNPASCNFGGELEVEFGKLASKSQAIWKKADEADYPSDAAREAALGKLEGKSYYQRLERSFNGLSITGIGQHYEAQSLYFADPPEKVMAAFRAAGYKVGKDGQFPSTDIYAGISAPGSEARSFAKSELGCGV